MMKYLYIDDRNTESSVQNWHEDGVLQIDKQFPTEKRSEFLSILEEGNYQGLILDQQLDEKIILRDENTKEYTADYRGSSLALDIRTQENELKIKENKDISIPIVIFSGDPLVPQILKSMNVDTIDLFIFKGEKTVDFIKNTPIYKKQLISLAKGYDLIRFNNAIDKILDIADLSIIDHRFVDELKRKMSGTVHSKAYFILNELILNQGILIDEMILSARLGVDIEKSNEGWKEVIKSLSDYHANYTGVFSDGWTRWWMPMIEKWWAEIVQEDSYLQFLSASQRVSILSERLGINLVALKAKSKFSIDDDYWTVCDISKDPLSIENGLMLPGQENLYPWQDARYVAIMTALDESIDVANSEQERLDYYKNLLNQKG